MSENIFRIPPFCYIHVLDQNTNVTRVEIGPQTFICKDNEICVFSSPEKMIVIPPRHYITIKNPVMRGENNKILYDNMGQIKLKHGCEEVRTYHSVACRPFPLYPGEKISENIRKLSLIPANYAYHMRVLQDYIDENEEKKLAGDEYILEGPRIYIPNVNVEKHREYGAVIIKKGQALRLCAERSLMDRSGNKRVAGEEWMISKPGSYLPGIYERVVSKISGRILTSRIAIHVRALKSFKDQFGVFRNNGSEYLITNKNCQIFFPSVNEEIIKIESITILTSRNYCVILDPWSSETQQNQLGSKKLVIGPTSFFLYPNEHLLNNSIMDVYVLSEEDGLLLSASEEFTDLVYDKVQNTTNKILRKPGDRWMIRGPMEYVPPVQAKVEDKRIAYPLHINEGLYIRDITTGRVRLERGKTYLLNENEEKWSKELPDMVEQLLSLPTEFGRIPESEMKKNSFKHSSKSRDKTIAVSYRVPANSAVQIYDFREKVSRVVFGPSFVLLGPDEMFTQLSLSGGAPKKPNIIKTLHLILGPDYMGDIITVETSDHAKLSLSLSYTWKFEPNFGDLTSLFSVSDFIGDACKQLSSRIRGAVAAVSFDDFHKNSARLIRASVFGINSLSGKINDRFILKNNNLNIIGIDIKHIEPINNKTKYALQQSIQQAISITTDAQQMKAKQEADRIDQQSRGKLQRQKINDLSIAEKLKKELNILQSETITIKNTGKAIAIANAKAKASKIIKTSNVENEKLISVIKKLKLEKKQKRLKKQRTEELKYLSKKQLIEENYQKNISKLQTKKFNDIINSIGTKTIKTIAIHGPQLQSDLLKSLGVKNAIITNSKI